MLRPIFAPANALLNRMGYTRKFTLLWLLSMVAITVVVYSLFISLDRVIQPSKQQLEGLRVIKPIAETIQSIQLHRGLSLFLHGGNESIRSRLAAQGALITYKLAAIHKQLVASPSFINEFQNIRQSWERLRDQGAEWDMQANFVAHTELIEQLQSFEVFVADQYLLTLDPEMASYYLIDTTINKLPHALEHLGQIRAFGTGVLSNKQITEEQRIRLHTQMSELEITLKELKNNLDKTGRHNIAISDTLRSTYNEISRSAHQVTGLVKADLITGRLDTNPLKFLEMATSEIDHGYLQMYNTLLPTAELLINKRIKLAKDTLYTSAGISLFVFVVVVYFTISIYHTIINNIHLLAKSARAFAGGNLATRARLNTRDEISVIADSFNEMADGFSTMLESRKRDEIQLLKEIHKNTALLRAASDGIHILDLDGNVLQVNSAFCRMLGYSLHEMVAMNAAQWDAQWTADQIKEIINNLGNDAVMLETKHRTRDGYVVDVEINVVKVIINGQPLIYCSSRDVTERKLAVEALTKNQKKLNAVIETALDAVVQMNGKGIITGWNAQAEAIFGWSREEVIGRNLGETIIPPKYREAHKRGVEQFLVTGSSKVLNSRVEFLGLHRNGDEFPVELSITAIDTSGEHEFNAFLRDITAQKKSEELIWRQANYDSLTELPNRNMFHDRLSQHIRKSHRTGTKTALLYIDLDKFKDINDTLGHGMGDKLLREAAQRIQHNVRECDTVARLGGDEFTVILADLVDFGCVERISEDILHSLAKPFSLGEEVVYLSASIGITLHPIDASDSEELLKNADQAMYAAKADGRNRFCFFTPAMQQAAQARLRMTSELRSALALKQFAIYYQPIVNLANGHIHKAEALIRWQHPELGIVNPAQFIPLAEDTGLIVDIGDWVFKEAVRQVKCWKSLYENDFQISVNVSPIQINTALGVTYQSWFEYLLELQVTGKNIVIEITEGLLLDADPDVSGKLLDFRDAGIQTAIDDFGTGYSSLAYLKKFDIDYLKIDQSFVRNLTTDSDDLVLSEAIIMMAHKLGMKVIAEGVETEEQRNILAVAGCDYAQGYLFSRPLPADAFEELLKGQQAAIKKKMSTMAT